MRHMENLILIVMLTGLATIAAGLAMMWPPLAVMFAGGVLCMIAVQLYRTQKEAGR